MPSAARREAGHDGAVAFLGDHHRVAAVQRQVVVGRRVAFEVVGNRVAAGFLGGVHQQLEVARQGQLLFLNDLHGVQGHDYAVLVVLGAAAVHAVADQGDLERVEPGAVLQHPVLRRHRHHVGMGVDAHHFFAAAFQGDLVDTVIDVAKVQVEGLGQALDLVGDLEELRVLVLRHAIDAHGGDRHQFAQGFGGGLAVLHPRIEAQQAMDLVLLLGGKRLVVEEGIDGRAEVGFFDHLALGRLIFAQGAEKLAEIRDRGIGKALENRRVLLWGDVGVGGGGEG